MSGLVEEIFVWGLVAVILAGFVIFVAVMSALDNDKEIPHQK